MVTLELTEGEARQLAAVLTIIRRKATKSTFWASFLDTCQRVLTRLPC